MYSNNFYPPHVNQHRNSPYQANPYVHQPYYNSRFYPTHPYYAVRQQSIQGQATWTEGGPITQCGIPWSQNQFMTAAVGVNTPYQCGQTIKIMYPLTNRELLVTVVDRVPGYPSNKINLHRKAFETLGANTDEGIINVEITPSPELEEEKWGKYLLEVTQTAYPAYNVTDYRSVEKTEVSPTQTREVYEFTLESPQERIKVRGTVIYNPVTDRIISFDIKEV
jgi:hypothetical protein